MNDTKLGRNWQVVQRFQHRHIYDVPEQEDAMSENDEENVSDMPVYQESEPFRISTLGFVEDNKISVPLSRNDVIPKTINLEALHHRSSNFIDNIDDFIEDSNESKRHSC